MKTYKWTCLGCETPNVFVHNQEKEGQVALSCMKCGTPGKFEKETVLQQYNRRGNWDVCSTEVMGVLDSATFIHTAAEPRNPFAAIDYASPQRVVKMRPGGDG